jgi:choline dehydrogenase
LDSFDYIIIGAGSAGCVIAGNLAAKDNSKILVLEAGPRDRSPWIHLAIGYGKSYYNPAVNWMYQTEPVPALAGRRIYQPRGKVVGGSSSINAMVYSRGQAEDYDGWAALGNRGWGWSDVLRLYRKMEDHDLGTSEWHGSGGPLHITDISKAAHLLTGLFIQAGLEAGLPFNPDLNGATTEGVGTFQITTRNGFRASAARAFLYPALKTGRVRLETEALVTRILFDGRRAIGVECRQHGKTKSFHAGAEIILCGGAINSPQILQLSGIGPAGLLTEHAVEVVADRPAVGRHFQDHLCYDHVYKSKLPSLNDDLLPLLGKVRAGLSYLLGRRGPLSLSVNQGGGFYRSRAGLDRPDIQLYFSPLSYTKALPGVRALMKPDLFSGFSTSVSPCRPLSRGHVAICSPDPTAAPTIEPNYLSAPEDVETLLRGARFLCDLAQTPTFKLLVNDELQPGAERHSDAELIDDIRQRAYSVFHPSGTCRMGTDPADCVVDPALRVYGVAGLRVADASIFPTVPSGNTGAPAMMVGEKASELILGGRRQNNNF